MGKSNEESTYRLLGKVMVKVLMKCTLLITTEQAPHHAKVQDHRA